MLGWIFCHIWAHHWAYANDNAGGVIRVHCTRCRAGNLVRWEA